MELSQKKKVNKYVIVPQDHLTKWLLAHVVLNQKTQTVVHVLVEELLPFFGFLRPCRQIGKPTYYLI